MKIECASIQEDASYRQDSVGMRGELQSRRRGNALARRFEQRQ